MEDKRETKKVVYKFLVGHGAKSFSQSNFELIKISDFLHADME